MRRRSVFAIVIAGLLAAAAYWTQRSQCLNDIRAFRGEVWVQPNGKTLYFDGQCWTTKPMPPRDAPF